MFVFMNILRLDIFVYANGTKQNMLCDLQT